MFPLCYGYWNKYAETEKALGNIDLAKAVYNRGLQLFPHSVDLWTNYCTLVAERSDNLTEIREYVLRPGLFVFASSFLSFRLFENAVRMVGTDALGANILWDKYIEFESSQEEYGRVVMLYTRLFHVPLQALPHYWERYDHSRLETCRPPPTKQTHTYLPMLW